jgi:uncharacterized protein with NRDE domain
MCLLAVYFRAVAEAPVLAAANREEFFDRPTLPPRLVALENSSERALCGLDARAGGTWLGVNSRGVFVAVTNRPKQSQPPAPRSRGRLCLDLLACRTAEEASRRALAELSTGRYAGANYMCLDRSFASVIHAGEQVELVVLAPGLHLLSNGDLDDPHDARLNLARELFSAPPIRSAAEFLTAAQRICSHYVPHDGSAPHGPSGGPSIVLRASDRGTVSSTLVALTVNPADAVYQYSPGPPDLAPYDDYSPLARSLYSDSRE